MTRWMTGALAALMLSTPAFADPQDRRDQYERHDERRDDRRYDRRDDRKHERHEERRDERHEVRDRRDGPPAWGLHKEKNPNHPKYRSAHSGVVYVSDYGVRSGRCDVKQLSTALGAGAGAVIGGNIADRDNRVAGIIVGSVVGAVLGNAIGESIDRDDRACMGHALELGAIGKPVVWAHAGHNYHFVPVREGRNGCRYAKLKVDGRPAQTVLACPAGRGEWSFRHP